MATTPSGFRLPWFRTLALFLCVLFIPLWVLSAQDPENKRVLHSSGEFWNLPPGEQDQEHLIDFTFTVFFYDAHWSVLWGSEEGTPFFLKTSGAALPMKPGDKVHFKGMISKEGGLRADPNDVLLIAHEPLPAAIDITQAVDRLPEFNQRIVNVTGMVDSVLYPDVKHTKMSITVNGHAVNVICTGQLPKTRIGAIMDFTGLLAIQPEENGGKSVNIWVSSDGNISLSGWAQHDDRFLLPLTPLGQVSEQASNAPVHVRGRLVAAIPGKSVLIRDDTGELLIETARRNLPNPGAEMEAVGSPSTHEKKNILKRSSSPLVFSSGEFDLPPEARTAKTSTPIITSGGGIHTIRPVDKDLPFDAVFRVLFYDPEWNTLWGEDSNSRFYIQPSKDRLPIKAGELVHIRGTYSPKNGLSASEKGVTILESSAHIPPVDISNRLSELDRYNQSVVQLIGYVENQKWIDHTHESLRLLVQDRRVDVIVLSKREKPLPRVEGAIVSIQGLVSRSEAKGLKEDSVTLLVPEPSKLRQLHWLRSDPRFSLPITNAAQLLLAATDSSVHVAGKVVAATQGRFVDLRDGTGQIRVFTLQEDQFQIGETIEAIGLPKSNGLSHSVTGALVQRNSASSLESDQATSSQTLRLAGQVLALSPQEAARKFPVLLTVLVTWSSPTRRDFYAEDGSAGLPFLITDSSRPPPAPGDVIEVLGDTDNSGASTRVRALAIRHLRSQSRPAPTPITLDQARAGFAQNQNVELRGLVRNIRSDGSLQELDMLCNLGSFRALFPPGEDLTPYLGSIVNVAGVCSQSTSGSRTPEITLYGVSSGDLTLLQAPADKLIFLPSRSLSSTALTPPKPREEQWIRTFGVVTLSAPGSHLYVQDGTAALKVFTRQTTAVSPGDHVDIIALPCWSGNQMVLKEAFVRKSKTDVEPKPSIPPRPYTPMEELENGLVSLEGSLVAALTLDGRTTFTLRGNGSFFTAELGGSQEASALGTLEEDAHIRLTGIYHVNTPENGAPGISLELRSASDVVVLESPPWWTAERALSVVGILSFVLLATAGWILQLRRLVQRQTQTIRGQLEKEAKLTEELERAHRLESLGMLAGGIAHDFNNMLTIIVGNLSLARMEAGVESAAGNFLREAELGASRARNLTQQLLTFSRGGAPARKAEEIDKLVREELADATSNGQLYVDYSFGPELRPAFVDRSQISQVLHSMANNSIQAGATRLIVRVENASIPDKNSYGVQAGDYLKLTLADDGPGIPAEIIGKVFDPYFTTHKGNRGLGLSLVRSIVMKHNGCISVSSEPCEGAVFTLLLPAAPVSNVAGQNASPLPTTPTPDDGIKPSEPQGACILLMDDEAPIRLMVSALLRKLGHRVVLTAEGGAAVREYRAALEQNRRFDLVILDLSVPNGMGGMEAMEQLRAMDPSVRAIVSSGYSNDPIMADHQSFGFAAMVPKPYQLNELASTLNSLLKSRA